MFVICLPKHGFCVPIIIALLSYNSPYRTPKYNAKQQKLSLYTILSGNTKTFNGPRSAKMCLRTYADSKYPDQPAHAHSLIMASTVR